MDATIAKPVLKISVLSSGAVLLDGKPTELDQLADALRAAKSNDGTVFYYREAAAATPPLQAMSVLNLVVQNKLPISLSSKPDFSDWVDNKGVSHPRNGQAAPVARIGNKMPTVAAVDGIEEVFANARKMAAGEGGPRGLVIVRPDRKYLLIPALAASPELDAQSAGLERLVPSAITRNIAVIADTGFLSNGNGAATTPPSIAAIGKSIPFLGNLMGLCYLGHAVWIFEGDTSALEAGCRDADLLFVDSGMLTSLQPGWLEGVAKVMRNANILIQDRASFQLRILRRAGESRDRLEFPH
ncbi:MAG TPA: hypothetical protein VGV35_20865 [Bryobacteraceae bacterium]|nr:hypothetical protein [Bryobacteraceae bacterium]